MLKHYFSILIYIENSCFFVDKVCGKADTSIVFITNSVNQVMSGPFCLVVKNSFR